MYSNYSWITDQLAVGGLIAAPDDHPFDAVLSVQTWCPLALAEAAVLGPVEYRWMPILDRSAYAPHAAARVFDGIAAQLDAWLRAGKRVLVHCHSGVSRSPAAIIWYLMRYRGLSWDAAYARVKACHRPSTPDVRLEIPLRLAHGDRLTTTWIAHHVVDFCRRNRTPGHALEPQAVWAQLARAGALPAVRERPLAPAIAGSGRTAAPIVAPSALSARALATLPLARLPIAPPPHLRATEAFA